MIIPFFFGDFTLPSWLVISFWFGKDIIGLVYETLNPSMQGGVAFGAHVGGMVAGLLICAGYRAIHGTRTSTDEA